MRRAYLWLCLVVVASAVYPESLAELIRAASLVNPIYAPLGIDKELADLKLEKSRIEAKGERELLSAELTFVQALESRRKSLQDFCDQAINAVFDVAVADVDARIAALSEASARDAQRDADRQYERGLLSEEDRANARLKLSSAELAREQASWVLEDAHRQLAVATGLAWQESVLPAVPDFVVPTDRAPWTTSDLGLRRAEIALRIAEFDVAGLPRNAAPYDRRIAEAALRKATVALEQARRSSERSFTSLAQTLRNQSSTLSIRSGELELQRSLLEDAVRRYERSVLSREDRDQQQIRALTAEKTYQQALRSYVRSIASYIVSTDADPRAAP